MENTASVCDWLVSLTRLIDSCDFLNCSLLCPLSSARCSLRTSLAHCLLLLTPSSSLTIIVIVVVIIIIVIIIIPHHHRSSSSPSPSQHRHTQCAMMTTPMDDTI
jgi:hypothetical protein